MKLIIDIPEKIEEYIKDYIPIGAGDNVFCYPDEIVRMIQNGTPIPDNATNGEVIKAFYPELVVGSNNLEKTIFLRPNATVVIEDRMSDWWNAPYKRS